MLKEQNLAGRKNEKQQIFPAVEEKFSEGFPKGYRPSVDGWSFSIDKMKETTEDGTYKLLILDLSIRGVSPNSMANFNICH